MKKSTSLLMFCILFFFGVFPHLGAIEAEAGFIEIEPIDYYFHNQITFNRVFLTSSRARLWYSFIPADESPGEKPLFIFFNGGPGFATSSGLMSFGTGPMTLDYADEDEENRYVANPNSWTGLGNLLYIDARQTGFSYSMAEGYYIRATRMAEFSGRNHNCFFDAADFVRVLLRFLKKHPAIETNEIIIVGESYGGIRATIMLHMLLNYRDYGSGGAIYQDRALVDEIGAHYSRVFPSHREEPVPPGTIAGQFAGQVLVQPLLSGDYQYELTGRAFEEEDSVIFQIAREEGLTYIPCRERSGYCNPRANGHYFISKQANRDYYLYIMPFDWTTKRFYEAARSLRYTAGLSRLTGVDVTAIDHFYPSYREEAYRVLNAMGHYNNEQSIVPVTRRLCAGEVSRGEAETLAVENGDMYDVFGSIGSWDRFFMLENPYARPPFYLNVVYFRGYDIAPDSPRYGRMFLHNALYVDTFITDAAYDLVIYSPVIPPSLGMYSEILDSSLHDRTKREGEERTGRILLRYKAGAFGGIQAPYTRSIRFPHYDSSGHVVTISQPREFLEDVSSWWVGKKGVEPPGKLAPGIRSGGNRKE